MSIRRIFSTDKNRLFQKDDLDLDLTTSNTQPQNTLVKMPLTSKNIFKSNGDNIIFKDHSLFTSPNNNYPTEKKESTNDLFNLESKINSLEYKLILLEQKNESLLAKLNSKEENFELKLKKLEKNNLEGKKNLKKAENTLAVLQKLNNDNSAEIKKKISFIHNNLEKEEENKNEQRKMDIEIQKNILNTITEKIKETIKAEVDARFKADLENKIFNQNIYNNTEKEIIKIKKEIEEINNNITSKIKILSKECSERAHNVSKYTDQQISQAVLGKNEIIENVKKYMEQFILQVKNNITAQNEQNKLFNEKLKNAETHYEKSKNDNFGYFLDFEKRLEKKMNTLKKYFEFNLKKHDNFLNSNMKNFSITLDKNFNFISNIIIDLRQKENEVFTNFEKKSKEMHKNIISDLEKICERIYQYENSLNIFDKQNDLLKRAFAQSLTAVKTRLDVYKVNQKILYTIENDLMQEQITFLQKDLEISNKKLMTNINELKENSQNSFSTIMLELERHQKVIDNNNNTTNRKINNLYLQNEQNEIKAVMNEILNNIENINLIDSLQNSKTSEFEINKIVQRQQNEINTLNKDTKDISQKNELLSTKLNNIENNFNNSYNNLQQNLDQIIKTQNETKQIELTEAVTNIMDKMITNVESQITKEKMENLSKYDLTKMTNSLNDMNEKINTINTSTQSNSDEISDIKISMKSLEDSVIKNISNKKNSDLNIKIAMNQMLNNVEFNNIYSLLNSNNNNKNIDFSDEFKQKCGEIADNKIKTELEKFKIENENLWKKAIEANEKLSKPLEIQQIINKVPPTVMDINDSAKRIMDVDYFNGENDNPKVPALDDKLHLIEGDIDENNVNDNNNENDNIEKNNMEHEKDEINDDKNNNIEDNSKEEDENNKEDNKENENEKEENTEEEKEEKEESNENEEKESKNEKDNEHQEEEEEDDDN